MTHIFFTFANAKRGCGKTTVALNLPICFARAGYPTLAIDLDQQVNLSAGLGVDLNKLNPARHPLLINDVPEIHYYLIEIRPRLKLLPNSIDIQADDLLEAKKVNREPLLRRQIRPISSNIDVILIDRPPGMRAVTVNALVIGDSLNFLIDFGSSVLLGTNQLLKTIAAVSEMHNPSLKTLVLPTLSNKRRNLDRLIRLQAQDFFASSLVLESVIHRYIGVAEATAVQKGVVENFTTS